MGFRIKVKNMKSLRIILVVLTLSVLAISYILSGQTDVESLTLSDRVLVQLRLVSQENVEAKAWDYHYYSELIRQVAHIVIYSLITGCIYLACLGFTGRNWLSVLVAAILVVSYAYYDEIYHQEAVNGRGYQWLDLVLNFIGCALALSVASMVTLVNRFMLKQERK